MKGAARCWGETFGPPTRSPPITRFKFDSIVLVGDAACGLRKDKTLACWKAAPYGGSAVYETKEKFAEITSTGDVLCAVKVDGRVSCLQLGAAAAVLP